MNSPLAVYLHDHLAGSRFAIQLLDTLRDQHKNEPLGNFSEKLLADINQDQDVLQDIIGRVGETGPDLKVIAAWVAEKASEWKLRRDRAGNLGVFEALEALALGVTGKLQLWRVLPVVAEIDPRLQSWDFQILANRAQEQYATIESQRLNTARHAFANGAG